jgi:beta-xylosidase
MRWIQTAITFAFLAGAATAQVQELRYETSPARNLGPEKEVMRRDPSDIIKVGELYYVWYTKGAQHSGYDATVWYATSSDGHTWIEKGEALARGPEGSWDEQSVFTPNILVAEEKYWLFYTAVPKPFINIGPDITKTAIGVAVSDSPDGPWEKLETNPVLKASDDPKHFDSMRVDDACLIVRNGKYWMYYKGRQWNNTPRNTKMGVAIAERPQGPYVKNKNNPIIQGGHEVVVWPYGKGVGALIGYVGPEGIAKTLQYADDGVTFTKTADLKSVPHAAGAFRPEAFTDNGKGVMIRWGVHIGRQADYFPFLERFDYKWQIDKTVEPRIHPTF